MCANTQYSVRESETASRLPHKQEISGSTPVPASTMSYCSTRDQYGGIKQSHELRWYDINNIYIWW